MAMDPHYVPKILSLTLAYMKNGDQHKFHAANEEVQHALMNDPVFFFLRAGGGILVLKVFPNAFPVMFPIVPEFYPIWFAQSSTPLYIN